MKLLAGKKIRVRSVPPINGHAIVELMAEFASYFRQHKNGYLFTCNVKVNFDDDNVYKPDLVIVTAENKNIINWKKAIFGAPDMVVEILSRSTMNKDLTVKKDTYEKYGVKEYWNVDPFMKVISVYILRDGKYELDDKYICYDDDELEDLTEDERAEVKFEISPSIYPDLKINIKDIFSLEL